ncbi:uncharacterized protein LOC134780248 [Penaeus indicus]|uniref:uncharacterized protein LOC134780248 n=1 Tax=Penaeus indicus TaxID=29960 RepID=UPI00300D6673
MSSLKCLTTVILFGLCVTPSETKYGQTCSTGSECRPGIWILEDCTDGLCVCSKRTRFRFDEHSLVPECSFALHSKTRHCSDRLTSALEECPPNSKCLDRKGCYCDDGYEFVGTDCQKVLYQKVMEPCHIQNGSIYVCDHKQHSFCGEKKCVCFD